MKFWTQMLTGDTTDNIPGCKGIGPKKAEKILAGLDAKTYGAAVWSTYMGNPKYSTQAEASTQYHLMMDLLILKDYTNEPMDVHMAHIQAVEYSDRELNIDNAPVLEDNQRSYEDDLLRPAADLPQQV